jgi:hypothetical protein
MHNGHAFVGRTHLEMATGTADDGADDWTTIATSWGGVRAAPLGRATNGQQRPTDAHVSQGRKTLHETERSSRAELIE